MTEHYDFNPKDFEIFKSNTCHTVKRLGNKGFIDEIVNKEYIEFIGIIRIVCVLVIFWL